MWRERKAILEKIRTLKQNYGDGRDDDGDCDDYFDDYYDEDKGDDDFATWCGNRAKAVWINQEP